MRTRRTGAEVAALVEQAKALMKAEKIGVDKAAEKVGLYRSVLQRHLNPKSAKTHRTARKRRGESGSVDVRSLPPRPKKKAKGNGRDVNPHDMSSLANRIKSLDKRLKKMTGYEEERKRLAVRLVNLIRERKLV